MSAIYLEKSYSTPNSNLLEPLKKVVGSSDPFASQIITKDINLFWEAYEKMPLQQRGEFFQLEYLEKGTPGLQAYIEDRIRDGNYLAEAIIKHPGVYSLLAKTRTQNLSNLSDQIYTFFSKLKELYPAAIFPDVYFVIGANNSGGTAKDGVGIIIGAEVMVQDKYYDKMVYVVAHELIHHQQVDPLSDDELEDHLSVLEYAIKEGGADFLGELISGGIVTTSAQVEFAKTHEREIWEAFLKDMHSRDWAKVESWFYGGEPLLEGAPHFLGYHVGYQICKKYYTQANDKDLAFKTILQTGCGEKILNELICKSASKVLL